MKEYTVIKDDNDVVEFRKYLQRNEIAIVAMDFESESNLHEYGEKLCLIQIYDGSRFFIVDPFNISRDEIAGLLEDKKLVKLFYGCESDLSLAYKQYQAKVKSVLDLKNMVDVLNFDKKGLDSVLSSVLGVSINDKKRYQMYNWTTRPVRKEALEYALSDVEHLFELNKRLMERIVAEGKAADLAYCIVRNRNEFDGKSIPTVFKSNDYKMLNAGRKALFQKIYDLRDGYARELNCPPNVVLSKECMFGLVKGDIGPERISCGDKVPDRIRALLAKSLTQMLEG